MCLCCLTGNQLIQQDRCPGAILRKISIIARWLHRPYRPGFLSEDPLLQPRGGSGTCLTLLAVLESQALHNYAYVANYPTGFIDPFGLYTMKYGGSRRCVAAPSRGM